MKTPASFPTRQLLPGARFNSLAALLRHAGIFAAVFAMISCASLPSLNTVPDQNALDTRIAVQVTQLAGTAEQARLAAAPPVTQTQQPTYTPLPTYTPFPTFTPFPTYTQVPTFTPLALAPTAGAASTATPAAAAVGHPYTLRVRNMFRSTYWIGTYQPYGGNFIKPLWYVEFYPPRPTTMRVFFCRYTSNFYNHWQDLAYDYSYNDPDTTNNWEGCRKWGYFNYWWDRGGLYNCAYLDFTVDQPFQEVGVP
jgi:hypothetical protein